MWIEEFYAENIKCFGKLRLKFGESDKPYSWIILSGENGLGKSTILQSIALMLAGPDSAIHLLPKPDGWLQDQSQPGKISIKIHSGPNDTIVTEQPAKSGLRYSLYITGNQRLNIANRLYTTPMIVTDPFSKNIPWLRENAFSSCTQGWFAAGYGSFRRITSENIHTTPQLQAPSRASAFSSQFNEKDALSTFERWFTWLDFVIAKESGGNMELYKMATRKRELATQAINSLLPEEYSFHSVTTDGQLIFKQGTFILPSRLLSEGFRSVLAFAGDLMWRLMEAFPESPNPLLEQGVVLIDELDTHLHPTWQRSISAWFRNYLPNIQVITSTHSPIITANSGKNAIAYKFKMKGSGIKVTAINEPSKLKWD